MKNKSNEELLRDIEKVDCDIAEFNIRIRRYQLKIEDKQSKKKLIYKLLDENNKK